MSKNILIFNYNDDLYDTGVPISEFKHMSKIHVDVVTGDEIVTFYYKNGNVERFDAAELANDSRAEDSVDNRYDIKTKDEFDDWLTREQSFDYAFD